MRSPTASALGMTLLLTACGPAEFAPLPPTIEPLFENPITTGCVEAVISWWARHDLYEGSVLLQAGRGRNAQVTAADVATLRYEACPFSEPQTTGFHFHTRNSRSRSDDATLEVVREYDLGCFECATYPDDDLSCPEDGGVPCDADNDE